MRPWRSSAVLGASAQRPGIERRLAGGPDPAGSVFGALWSPVAHWRRPPRRDRRCGGSRGHRRDQPLAGSPIALGHVDPSIVLYGLTIFWIYGAVVFTPRRDRSGGSHAHASRAPSLGPSSCLARPDRPIVRPADRLAADCTLGAAGWPMSLDLPAVGRRAASLFRGGAPTAAAFSPAGDLLAVTLRSRSRRCRARSSSWTGHRVSDPLHWSAWVDRLVAVAPGRAGLLVVGGLRRMRPTGSLTASIRRSPGHAPASSRTRTAAASRPDLDGRRTARHRRPTSASRRRFRLPAIATRVAVRPGLGEIGALTGSSGRRQSALSAEFRYAAHSW